MKKCIKCGKEISDNAKFCGFCGAKQVETPKFCEACGAKIPEGVMFCEECGAPVGGTLNNETKQASNPFDFGESSDLNFGTTSGFEDIVEEASIESELSDFTYEKNKKNQYIITGYENKFETDVVIPEGVYAIDDNAFQDLDIKKVKLPDSLKIIGKKAFKGCKKLSSINIPKKLNAIGDMAFMDCISLDLELPNDIDLGSDVLKNTLPELRKVEAAKNAELAAENEKEKKFINDRIRYVAETLDWFDLASELEEDRLLASGLPDAYFLLAIFNSMGNNTFKAFEYAEKGISLGSKVCKLGYVYLGANVSNKSAEIANKAFKLGFEIIYDYESVFFLLGRLYIVNATLHQAFADKASEIQSMLNGKFSVGASYLLATIYLSLPIAGTYEQKQAARYKLYEYAYKNGSNLFRESAEKGMKMCRS